MSDPIKRDGWLACPKCEREAGRGTAIGCGWCDGFWWGRKVTNDGAASDTGLALLTILREKFEITPLEGGSSILTIKADAHLDQRIIAALEHIGGDWDGGGQ